MLHCHGQGKIPFGAAAEASAARLDLRYVPEGHSLTIAWAGWALAANPRPRLVWLINRLFARIATTEVCPGALIAAFVVRATFLVAFALAFADQSAAIARAEAILLFSFASFPFALRALSAPTAAGLTTLRAARVASQQSRWADNCDAVGLAAPLAICEGLSNSRGIGHPYRTRCRGTSRRERRAQRWVSAKAGKPNW